MDTNELIDRLSSARASARARIETKEENDMTMEEEGSARASARARIETKLPAIQRSLILVAPAPRRGRGLKRPLLAMLPLRLW